MRRRTTLTLDPDVAISGKVPPTCCIIPEYEVFMGKVAFSPYSWLDVTDQVMAALAKTS